MIENSVHDLHVPIFLSSWTEIFNNTFTAFYIKIEQELFCEQELLLSYLFIHLFIY